jgi:assimilatory nitrate reductase catalytic subunit
MGPFSITGQPNAMGGREVGGLANMLAAHMDLGNAEHRRIVQTFWNSPKIASTQGLKAVDLFDAIHERRVKAVWIIATNPIVSMPDADKVREALQRCELVVVSDCVARTDTTAFAHVLLPALAWGKNGTVTNSGVAFLGSVRSRRRAKPCPTGGLSVKSQANGLRTHFYKTARDVFVEHARLSAFENKANEPLTSANRSLSNESLLRSPRFGGRTKSGSHARSSATAVFITGWSRALSDDTSAPHPTRISVRAQHRPNSRSVAHDDANR